jgi:hypothetical protein
MSAKFIKLTGYSGEAVYINPAFVSAIVPSESGPYPHSSNFKRSSVHTTNWATDARETPEQILALIEGAKP